MLKMRKVEPAYLQYSGLHESRITGIVFAQYNDTCNAPESYPSTKGTLTLTAAGSTFEFTGQNRQDKSKIVQVSGSFSEMPVKDRTLSEQ